MMNFLSPFLIYSGYKNTATVVFKYKLFIKKDRTSSWNNKKVLSHGYVVSRAYINVDVQIKRN